MTKEKLEQENASYNDLLAKNIKLEKENMALRVDWDVMKSAVTDYGDLLERNIKLEKENARLKQYISDLEEKWQRFEELSKEMR